ncbi:MAG: PrsW family intramembrane metalloprotease [Leptolyngbyaceae cyanobacterium RU_5_1]|nr:PrsW family intramembrane metalloprotease [Leptolyngbyaceae cyanobacterium RU_5_1]
MTTKDRYVAFLRQFAGREIAEQKQPYYLLSASEAVVLGRDPRCQVVLNPSVYRSVSRRHAEITPVLGFESPDGMRFWQIRDLGSSNGTFLNGKRLGECQVLRIGDRVMLGQNGPEFVFDYQPESAVRNAEHSKTPASPLLAPNNPTTPPPVRVQPRREENVSLTQLFPILSTGQELAHKAYLLPAMITITFVVLLFLAIGNPPIFNLLLAAYLAIAAYYFIYQLCGKRKPWWLIAAIAATTIFILVSPVLDLFTFVFHRLLPGDLSDNGSPVSFPVLVVKMFFGAGLMEELLKTIPVLVVYWLGTWLKPPWREQIGVWEPLDGILLGAASAVGFALMETLGVYVPATYKSALMTGQDAAQLAGLQLLIPRVLGLVAGHIAYSGYLGYFIGLGVLRRRQRKLIIGVGYLTAAVLHTLWNTAGEVNPILLTFVGVISYAFLGAAILKARALSPTRPQNFATRFHR